MTSEATSCSNRKTYLLVDETVDGVVDTDVLSEHSALGENADGLDGTRSASLEGAVDD